MMEQRIIVNADDLGLCGSVNDAIFAVHRAGNLSSATLMVAMPGTEDAVERAKDHPGLGIGLHFTLTEGKALTGVSSLTDAAGGFHDRATLVQRGLRRQLVAADIRREFGAQLARAEQLGVRLTHSDSHQHVMMLPAVFNAIRPVIGERRLPVRLVDPPAAVVRAAWARPKKGMKQWINRRIAQRHRLALSTPANDALVSIHDLADSGPYTAGTYDRLLATARGTAVVEVMVHPYIVGEDVRTMYADTWEAKRPFLQRCAAEYDVLASAPVFAQHRMINFSEL